LNPNGFKGFFMPLSGLYPSPYPLVADSALDVPLHPLSAVPLHLFGYMAVHIEDKSGGGMAQVALDSLDTVPILQRQHRKSVPIGYNKDKSEIPVLARVS